MRVTTTIRTGPSSTELNGLDKAIETHPIWTELTGPVRTYNAPINLSDASGLTPCSMLPVGDRQGCEASPGAQQTYCDQNPTAEQCGGSGGGDQSYTPTPVLDNLAQQERDEALAEARAQLFAMIMAQFNKEWSCSVICGLESVWHGIVGMAKGVVNDAIDCVMNASASGCINTAINTLTVACIGVSDGLCAPVAGLARFGKTAEVGVKAADEGVDVAANAGRDAAESCLNSFTGDTPVLMADGSKKPIDQVKVGDKVIATDPETGVTDAESVVELIHHSGRHAMVAVTLVDGSVLDSTDGHPIWDATRQAFVEASQLRVGDKIETNTVQPITISALTDYTTDLTAYNLQIDQIHTYYAGTTPVLVHNSCTPEFNARPNFNDPAESPGEGWQWRGTGDPESGKGSWYNPNTGESLHPDLGHPDPIGPHYDWKASDGVTYRVYPDGSVLPK